MKTLKLLFTGIGRRVELIQAFRQAANHLNIHLKIYGADMLETAPALIYCDAVQKVCSMKDENYILELLKICEKEQIDMLIPTIDTDLLVLSQNVEKFEQIGTKVLVSKTDKIAVCRNKNLTADFFASCGLKAPKTVNNYQDYKGTYPCFIKPKDGSSSINAFKVENESELEVYAGQIEDYIIQPFIEGTEYTVDIFCDYEGKAIFVIPRVRMAVRAGEVLKTKITMDERIIAECQKLLTAFRPCGPMTVQLIRQNETEDDYYIEINPRFGGGAPLSMKAGARSAEVILKLLSGEKVDYSDVIDDGAVYSRFDQSVCTAEGKRKQSVLGVIFDLDDTLYSEKQYVRSGYKVVVAMLSDSFYPEFLENYSKNRKEELLKNIKQSINILSMISGICLSMLLVYAKDFYMLWLPDNDANLLRNLTILGTGTVLISGCVYSLFSVFSLTNKVKANSMVLLITGILSTVTTFLCLKFTNLGVYAIVGVSSIYGIVRNLTFTPIYAAKCLNFKFWTFYPVIFKNLLNVALLIVVENIMKRLIVPNTWLLLIVNGILDVIVGTLITLFIMFNAQDRKTAIKKILRK